MKIRPIAISMLAAMGLGRTALAGDWYVDAAFGLDSNSGSSPGSAWRTLTHAMATAPAPPQGSTQVIHLGPGTYDTNLGEVFPVLLRDAFQIVGDQGQEVTVVDAGGADALFRAWYSHLGGNYVGPLTLVRGLTLRNAKRGVDVAGWFGSMSLSLEDMLIEQMSEVGYFSLSGCGMGCGIASARLTRVVITGSQAGVEFRNASTSPSSAIPVLRLENCEVTGNQDVGVRIASDAAGSLSCNVSRTQIQENGSDGLLVEIGNLFLSGPFSVRLVDSLSARNGGSGVRLSVPGSSGGTTSVALGIQGCTIADNASTGLDVFVPDNPGDPQHVTRLAGTIVYGNQDDVRENPGNPTITSVGYCDVGDGDFAGSNGNFSADPTFRDPAIGDYRLRWGSPCIDTGDPAAPGGGYDLSGFLRPIDGDLDAVERVDVGANEFGPLGVGRKPHVGGRLVLELWGPAGGQGTLFFSRRPPAPVPLSTPYGDFDLDPLHFSDLGVSPVAPGPPALRVIGIPNDPSYAGRRLSFQVLATSTVGTPTLAYTNPVSVTILP